MSNCQNCFNGCTETVSDQCVRYTGINVPELGISTGDPLSVIEQSLTTFLVSTLDGTGVKIDLNSIDVCALVQAYLPTCGEISIADISKALIQAACDLQDQVDVIDATLTVLNADYTIPVNQDTGIPCLTGVTSSSDTHAIVQATITKLCSVDYTLGFIIDQLPSYALKSEICTLVDECLNNNTVTGLASAKMLPYTVIPYYGAISNYPSTGDSFDGTGAGLGYWARVFMCNGDNGTPDLRGRVPVGATNTPSTNGFPTQTNPATPGNPTYGYKDSVTGIQGNNTTILSLPQIPAHTHVGSSATSITTIPPHSHTFTHESTSANTGAGIAGGLISSAFTTTTSVATLLATTTTSLTIVEAGNNEAHSNVQPGLAVYYIMYIPA